MLIAPELSLCASRQLSVRAPNWCGRPYALSSFPWLFGGTSVFCRRRGGLDPGSEVFKRAVDEQPQVGRHELGIDEHQVQGNVEPALERYVLRSPPKCGGLTSRLGGASLSSTNSLQRLLVHVLRSWQD